MEKNEPEAKLMELLMYTRPTMEQLRDSLFIDEPEEARTLLDLIDWRLARLANLDKDKHGQLISKPEPLREHRHLFKDHDDQNEKVFNRLVTKGERLHALKWLWNATNHSKGALTSILGPSAIPAYYLVKNADAIEEKVFKEHEEYFLQQHYKREHQRETERKNTERETDTPIHFIPTVLDVQPIPEPASEPFTVTASTPRLKTIDKQIKN